ncbi:hypothetical protein ACLK1T_25210 [Escherichia coli]
MGCAFGSDSAYQCAVDAIRAIAKKCLKRLWVPYGAESTAAGRVT